MPATATSETLREQLSQAITQLPEEHLVEVKHYIEYLQYRETVQQSPPNVVALEGLWKDVPLDVTHDDVRTLRRQVTHPLTQRTE